jgi:hypothetical protein
MVVSRLAVAKLIQLRDMEGRIAYHWRSRRIVTPVLVVAAAHQSLDNGAVGVLVL